MRYQHLQKIKEIGEKDQKQLEKKTVSIVGVGGVGSILAEMLVRSGVNLRIIDKDRIYEEDLSRQSMYPEELVTRFKAKESKKILESINNKVKIRTFHEELAPNNAYLIVSDCAVDLSNNFETNQLVEKFAKKTPLWVCRTGGLNAMIYFKSPQFNVKKLEKHLNEYPLISDAGIFPSVTHSAATFLYTEIIKILLNRKKSQVKGLITIDSWNHKISVKKK
ncbi:ThiF family adenylyltransferase [Candidatus Woesearchaeota archaeon]|nr:ThiF family adenylyltransferase [Candidatus Woesearchaeota archaeon]